MLPELLESMRVIALPTKTNFRGVTNREIVLFKGAAGWSEFSPFLEYSPSECVPWLQSAIAAATKAPPKLYREKIKVNGTIPELNDAAEIKGLVDSFPGVSTFKVKVGADLTADIARLRVIRGLLPEAKLRVDVNGAWSVATAVKNLTAIYDQVGPLEYVEQPCASVDELCQLKEQIRVPLLIAGDEVIRKAADPFTVNLQGAVDILVLKVAPLGGIERSHQIAEHFKLPIVVSSALESAVGISYGLKLAASFKDLTFDCGLGTGSLLKLDVADLPIIDGEIAVVDVEPRFEDFVVSPERQQWWKNRILQTIEKSR
jgi:O-succinylbenzoate synthase